MSRDRIYEQCLASPSRFVRAIDQSAPLWELLGCRLTPQSSEPSAGCACIRPLTSTVRPHEGRAMLHPRQFEVNEAWIAFRLNRTPIRTELEGSFNCFALMDAASCFILGTELVPFDNVEPSSLAWRRLLRQRASRRVSHFEPKAGPRQWRSIPAVGVLR